METLIFSGLRRHAKPVGFQTEWRLRRGLHLQQLRIRLLLSGMSTLAFGWMSEVSNTLSQKLTVPLQLQLDSVSDGLKEEYRSLLGSLRDDLYSLKMETAGFHGTLDQRLVNALRTLFNEVSDETVNNTTHLNNSDDTGHPTNPLVNWIISGIWFWLNFSSKFNYFLPNFWFLFSKLSIAT